MPLVVTACVAIGEGRKGAAEPTENEENAAEPLAGGVAITAVGQNGIHELEHEDCTCREKLYEAAKC